MAGGILVMLRAPRSGQVKSRLAAEVGEAAALQAYRRLLATTRRTLAPLPRGILCGTPDDALPELQAWCPDGWPLWPQGPGDLGERMHRALTRCLSATPGPWIVIGTDCPWLTRTDLETAGSALETADVVLGPAADGGYWLIGVAQPRPELFEGIAWGSARVLQQTLDRAAAAGLRTRLLRTLRDVDTAQDWLEACASGILAPDGGP